MVALGGWKLETYYLVSFGGEESREYNTHGKRTTLGRQNHPAILHLPETPRGYLKRHDGSRQVICTVVHMERGDENKLDDVVLFPRECGDDIFSAVDGEKTGSESMEAVVAFNFAFLGG